MKISRQRHVLPGFTVTELMVTVAIIGILSSITIVISGNEWRRERVNAVAIDFAGWLEQIRSSSLREIDTSLTPGGCVITVNTFTSAAPGTALATVLPTRCSPSPSFNIPGAFSAGTLYSANVTNATTITFTPRGSVILADNSADAVVRIFLNGSTLVRCIKTSSGLGVIRIGANNSAADASSECPSTAYSGF